MGVFFVFFLHWNDDLWCLFKINGWGSGEYIPCTNLVYINDHNNHWGLFNAFWGYKYERCDAQVMCDGDNMMINGIVEKFQVEGMMWWSDDVDCEKRDEWSIVWVFVTCLWCSWGSLWMWGIEKREDRDVWMEESNKNVMKKKMSRN